MEDEPVITAIAQLNADHGYNTVVEVGQACGLYSRTWEISILVAEIIEVLV